MTSETSSEKSVRTGVCRVFFPRNELVLIIPWLVVSAVHPSENMFIIGITIRKMAENKADVIPPTREGLG